MVAARVVLFSLAAACVVACIEPLSAGDNQCTPTPFDLAAVNGDTITVTTGLRYVNGDSGIGVTAPWCRMLIVHYTGYLLNGTKFDSSIDIGRALVFIPGDGALIDGFEQGVIGMRACSTRRLIIPPVLAYGANEVRNSQGQVLVPANSTVVYDIQMLQIGGELAVDCENPGA